jgi:hypothetical protein
MIKIINVNLLTTLGLSAIASSSLPALSQVEPAPAQAGIRHAYQTAPYTESFRKRYASLTAQYLAAIAYRNRRSGYAHALDAGRAAESARSESARRAYSTRHSNNSLLGGTRHAYQT